MIEGFLGFEIFNVGIFGGGWKILASIFNLKIHGSSHVSRPHGSASKFLWLRN